MGLGAGPAPVLKRKREVVADSESEEGEVGSDQEFGWKGGEERMVEGLEEVDTGIRESEGGDGVPGDERQEEAVEQASSEGSEEAELRNLIEQALEEEMYNQYTDYGDI